MKSKNKVSAKNNKDEREFLAGKVRSLEKRLRVAERENARLSKYIRQLSDDTEDDSDLDELDDSLKICGKNKCQSTDFHHLITAQKHYITCKQCGNRNVERNLDTSGQ